METSKEIIEQAKKRFKELKHKKYDEPSFFAGFLEAKASNMKKDFELEALCEPFICEHKYQDNVCDWRGVRKCLICGKIEPRVDG